MNQLIENYVTFPCNGKVPKIKNWNNLTHKTAPKFHSNENYGILTGKINNLIVIDCDLLKQDDPDKYICGVQFWKQIQNNHSFLQKLPFKPKVVVYTSISNTIQI